MVPQGSDSQTSEELGFFMEIAPDSSGGQLNMNNNLRSFNPKIPPPDPELLCLRASCEQTESLQIEPQTEPPSSGRTHTEPPHIEQVQQTELHQIKPQQIEPQPFEPQQMEPGQFEPEQFETQWMQPQHFEQQQMEPQEIDPQDQSQVEPLSLSPPSPYWDGIIESEDIDFQLSLSPPSPYCDGIIESEDIDLQSESSFEDEALKSMPLKDVIRKYPY